MCTFVQVHSTNLTPSLPACLSKTKDAETWVDTCAAIKQKRLSFWNENNIKFRTFHKSLRHKFQTQKLAISSLTYMPPFFFISFISLPLQSHSLPTYTFHSPFLSVLRLSSLFQFHSLFFCSVPDYAENGRIYAHKAQIIFNTFKLGVKFTYISPFSRVKSRTQISFRG